MLLMSSKEMAKAAAAKAGLNRTQFPFFLPPLFLDLGCPAVCIRTIESSRGNLSRSQVLMVRFW